MKLHYARNNQLQFLKLEAMYFHVVLTNVFTFCLQVQKLQYKMTKDFKKSTKQRHTNATFIYKIEQIKATFITILVGLAIFSYESAYHSRVSAVV